MANTIPVAGAVESSTFEDGVIFVTLTASDVEDGASAKPSFTLSGLPTGGTLYATDPLFGPSPPELAQTGIAYVPEDWAYDDYLGVWTKTFFFVPAANWSGSATFDYVVTDSAGDDSAPATVMMTVEATADAPAVDANVHDQPDPINDALNVSDTNQGEDSPQLVALDGGGFVAVWQQELFSGQIFGRYYDQAGVAAGSAFAITPSGGTSEMMPVATALPGGGFAVAWVQLSMSTFETGVAAKVYAAGSTTATAFDVATTGGVAETNPTITALDAGFVITWAVESGNTATILAQRYTSAGSADGGVTTITTAADHGSQTGPTFSPPPHGVTALANGSYVVAWSEDGALVGSVVANGTVGAAVPLVSTGSGGGLASFPDGSGFVVAYVIGGDIVGDIYVQAFDAGGAAKGPAIQVTDTEFADEFVPVISVLPDGRFVVAWIGNNGADGSADVFAQVLLPDGTPNNGGPIKVTGTGIAPDGFNLIWEIQPTITTLENGHFAVGWLQPFATGGQNHDVFTRIYNPGPGIVSGIEDQPLALPSTVSLADTDGSEILRQLRIEGLPAGFSISDGTSIVGSREGGNPSGAWIIDAADAAQFLAGLATGTAHLTLIPAADFVGQFQLSIAATSKEVNDPIAEGWEEATSPTALVTVVFVDAPEVNRPPAAQDDTPNNAGTPVVANPGAPLVTFVSPASVLANDSDPDTGETALLRVTQAGASEASQVPVAVDAETEVPGSYGTLHINAEGSYVYKLDGTRAATMGLAAGVQATEQFVYTAANNGGGSGNQDTATLSIIVQGVNDAPRDIAISSDSVDENVPNGTVVGTLTAFDPDGNPLTWTLTDSAGGRFALDSNTGLLTVANGNLLDYETQQSHAITVTASDGTLATTRQLSVALNNVNEAPTAQFIQHSEASSISENAATTEQERGLLNIFDDGLGSEIVSLSGQYADLFRLSSAGSAYRLYLKAGFVPNYELDSTIEVTIDIDDPTIGDGPEVSIEHVVPVTDTDDPAVTSSVMITMDEDATRVLTSADFPYLDPEGVRTLLQVEIINAPSNGKLYYDPTGGDLSDAIVVNGARTVTKAALDAGRLWFKPDLNENGPAYASFNFQVADSQGLSNVAGMSFTVNAVNDAPQWTAVAPLLEYREGETIGFGKDISILDVDLAALNGGLGDYSSSLVTLRRSAGANAEDVFGFDPAGASFRLTGNTIETLAGQSFGTYSSFNGQLSISFANNGAIPTSALVHDVLRRITYVNTRNDLPEQDIDFRWVLNDGNFGDQGSGAALSATATTRLHFRPENDAPVNSVPGTQLVNEDTDLVFGLAGGNAITISDVDAGSGEIEVVLRVDHGTLTLASTTGLNVVEGNGTARIELRGALAQVNAALEGLTYRAAAMFVGSDTLEIRTDDRGSSGTGGNRIDHDTVAIYVAPFDHPTITNDDSAATDEDTPVTLGVLGNDSDVDGPLAVLAIDGMQVSVGSSVAVANGSVMLNADGTLTFAPAADFNGTTSFTYLAGSGLHYQFFDRTDETRFTTVASIPIAGGIEGVATDFDVTALATGLSGDADDFGVRYTGSINVAAGGTYAFYTTSDDGSALYIDGVMVVDNDLSQVPTERSGTVTLTAGAHAIEIRYFEGGGGETLQVHVSGPDTAGAKTTLLESALTGAAAANVEISVAAVNDAPQLANLGNTIIATEQSAVLLDLDATVSDADLDAHNGGAGLYTGASLTLAREGGANTDDSFDFDVTGALFTVSGSDLNAGGASFATFSNAGGTLTITFTSAQTPATSALVNDVLRHITYINSSDAPPGQVVVAYTFDDGNSAEAQGSGGAASAAGTTTVDIAPVDDPTTVNEDSASTTENAAAFIDVLGNDSDADASLWVRAINGAPIAVNGTVTVADGRVSLGGDGTLVFEPNAGFNGETSFTYQAGTGLHYQFFDRDQTPFTSVTQIPVAGGIGGTATDFDVGALALNLTGSDDTFGIRYTGAINVTAGGGYTFYTTSDDGSALYVDGAMVVNNDFSQVATERFGTVTLTAGIHAIEIRYFEGGGGQELQVHVSGPDTADTRTALLESSLLTFSATVNVDVAPVNDPPQLINLNYAVNALEQTGLLINADVTVFDADLDALNGGNGLYTGASLTLARQGGANAEDVFLLDTGTLFTVNGDELRSGGLTFATFSTAGGTLTITFTSAGTPATSMLVNDVMRHIVYRNTSDTPAPVVLVYAFHDGGPGNGQGGGAATATGTMTIDIAPIDDETVTQADTARTAEDTPVIIDVLGNDTDVDTTLAVTAIDDTPIAIGGAVTVANGSVTLNADGTLTFAPASDFNGETTFTYRLNTAFTATVTVTVDPVDDAIVVGGDHHAVVAEGGMVTLTKADLTASDADVPDSLLVYAVTAAAHGVVLVSGAAATSFTQADLAVGLVAFQHDGSEDSGSITLSLTGGGAAAQVITVGIDVDPHGNDAPVALHGTASGDEDTAISGAALATDVDNTAAELAYTLIGDNGGALHGTVAMNADGTYLYLPFADFSGTDSFAFRATDAGGAESNTAMIAVTVNPVKDFPDGTVQAAPLLYLENQGTVTIDPALTVTDPDSTDLVGATVAITAFAAGDVLGFVNQNGIAGSFDTTAGVLTLTGTSSLANYQAALRSVTYANTSENPSNAARTISFHVDDGGGLVSLGNAVVTVQPVNDAPSNAFQPAYDVEANTLAALDGLAVSDIDADAGVLTTTLSVAHGALTVASIGGAAVVGSGTSSVVLSGTLAQINATLAAAGNVRYRGAQDFFGDDTLTLTTNDGGNSGSDGALIDSDQATIHVNTWLTGTPDDDSFAALPGNVRIDALGGNDTITFDFRLVDATVTYRGNEVIIDSGSSHTVLTGFQKYVFTDGTVETNDGNVLIDDLFYYSRNHDVWNAQVEAEDHFNMFGWQEGRDPSAFFSTAVYLSVHADVKAAGANPLGHFESIGWIEGRLPSLTFDLQQYLAHNPDVAAAHVDPLAHFLQYGGDEGRQPFAPSELIAGNGFDYVYYLQHNPDVAAAHVDPFEHFQTVGWQEGRNPNALFDTVGYLAAYADVAAAQVNPLDHYHLFGWLEGRDPSVGFDTTSYLAANPDVAAAHVDPLAHFLRFGIHEGRAPHADGIWG